MTENQTRGTATQTVPAALAALITSARAQRNEEREAHQRQQVNELRNLVFVTLGHDLVDEVLKPSFHMRSDGEPEAAVVVAGHVLRATTDLGLEHNRVVWEAPRGAYQPRLFLNPVDADQVKNEVRFLCWLGDVIDELGAGTTSPRDELPF